MNPVTRHSEVRDARALQEIYSQVETIMGTLQVPFPAEESWKRRLTTRIRRLGGLLL